MTTSALLAHVQPITSAEPGTFANKVILERHPAIIRQILEDRPCDRAQSSVLNTLLEETISGPLTPLPPNAVDSSYWLTSGQAYFTKPWTEVPFLWAESFFYRRLLQGLKFFDAGPWRWVDPFQLMKSRELAGEAVSAFLEGSRALNDMTNREAFAALVRAALMGNRADLGFRMGGSQAADAGSRFDLIDDQTEAIWQYITGSADLHIVILADNAGLEVLSDLMLCDFLIARCGCSDITLHLKPTPYYVSDATTADVLMAVRRLRQGGSEAKEACARIMAHALTGRLKLSTHEFYCRPEYYWMAPPDLRAELAAADLVIAKGDLNYRRLVGDVECDATIPFEDACAYFPAPLAALRVLKSDVAVGIQPSAVSRLEATGEKWRTDGSRGVIQFAAEASGG